MIMLHSYAVSPAVEVLKCVSVKTFLQPTEERQAKSTGVFQDEELLFSQKQQKDNDPDVDLFATSEKAGVSILDVLICLKICFSSLCKQHVLLNCILCLNADVFH